MKLKPLTNNINVVKLCKNSLWKRDDCRPIINNLSKRSIGKIHVALNKIRQSKCIRGKKQMKLS